MSEEQAAASQFVVKCPKCGEGHNPGVFRCTKCNASLRPTFLGVFTLAGPVFLILLAVASLAQAAQHPSALVAFGINVAGVFVLVGLHMGKYWAWTGIQVMWVINIAFSAIPAIVIGSAMYVGIAGQALVIVLLWIYIHSERVKAFCSVGRPSK